MNEANRLIKACLEKEEAFCASSCPFHYDIREFISRLRRGSFNAAFRCFANGVAFPGIVSALCDEACKSVCPRAETDAAVELRLLEKAAMANAVNLRPNSYNMPPKEAKIAIVGAGLSGLGCALRLSNRKYRVTVFERSGRIGGRLWEKLEPEIFLKDIETQFMYEEYELRLNTNIADAAALLGEYQAVYVASGAESACVSPAPAASSSVPPYASQKAGIFSGGAATGARDMEALAQGLRAADLIEAYLKTGNMKGAEAHKPTRMKLAPGALSCLEPPARTDAFDREAALTEAKRCLVCRCDACYRSCPMMRYFEKMPARIADEVAITVNPGTLDGNGTVATRLISTCSQCGLCAKVCPEQIDTGHFLRRSHEIMRAKGAMPWVFHDFYLRDMADARGPGSAFRASPAEKPRYLFFPGCQLGASEPNYVLGSYALLRGAAEDTALHLGCCGAPAVWAGDLPLAEEVFAEIRGVWNKFGRPLVILACPSCLRIFAEYLPEIKTVFLFDHLTALGIKPERADRESGGTKIAVFDPCAMRGREASRENMRKIAAEAGYLTEELPDSGEEALCCSFGGQIDITNPPFREHLAKQRAGASALPYLVYCVNCRDVFAEEGKEVTHALEIFPGCERKSARKLPGIEERLLNRRALKEEIVRRFFPGQAGETPPAAGTKLSLISGLAEKLDRERIFLSDVSAVIDASESSRRRIRLPSGHFSGHIEIGRMTYWVEYLPEQGGYTVFNAYAHRMTIEGGG